jgi:hypothetical protein
MCEAFISPLYELDFFHFMGKPSKHLLVPVVEAKFLSISVCQPSKTNSYFPFIFWPVSSPFPPTKILSLFPETPLLPIWVLEIYPSRSITTADDQKYQGRYISDTNLWKAFCCIPIRIMTEFPSCPDLLGTQMNWSPLPFFLKFLQEP